VSGPLQDPPVVEWLRGKATSYRRAATTAATSGNDEQAAVYRQVATHLGDVAQDLTAYLEKARL
jgi:ribosomal protein S3AE